MASKAKRHNHKYHHIDMSFGKVWACALPDCNHYMPQHMESMLPGKYSICWECGEKMVLDSENMKESMPRCTKCRFGIEEKEIEEKMIDTETESRLERLKKVFISLETKDEIEPLIESRRESEND